MTAVVDVAPVPHEAAAPRGLLAFLITTDHKRIGLAYMVTAFAFFLVGGLLALVMRAELYSPGLALVSESRFNELFTMHGTIMVLLFLGPFSVGLANYVVPLQIGARDMAFPRLNAMSYWFFLFGGITMLSGFLSTSGAADFGWTGYAPLSNIIRSPGVGGDLWIMGVVLTGLSSVLTAVNVITTVFVLRTPGMTMFRLPIFCWNMVAVSVLMLIAFPMLTAAGAFLFADRRLGAHVFDAAAGGAPLLWQHLFWFFGHPEVYILALPFFGVITEVLPVFSRRPVFAYTSLVLATMLIAAYSVGVWAHHMFTTGAVLLPFFSGLSFLIAVPTGIKFFNWIGTMWGGQISFRSPMLFAIGFLLQFLVGGVTGVILASPSLDFHLHDSYFVVAHMHYVLVGGLLFGMFAGVYYWFPKMTGRRLSEKLGLAQFLTMLIGFNLTFFVQHMLGMDGMPRRVPDYVASDGFTTLNRVSTIGSFLLGLSTLLFIVNVVVTLRRGRMAGANPWDGHTLEWATTSPPPPHNFDELPPIGSNRPTWDLNHP